MNPMRDAFEFLVAAEKMGDAELSNVISSGSFSGEAGRGKRMSVSATATASPAQQAQMSSLQAECTRLREQLSLAQGQLAKSIAQLDELKTLPDAKATLSKKKAVLVFGRRSSKEPGAAAPAAPASSQPSSRRVSGGEDAEALSNAVVVSTTRQLDAERGRTATLEEELHKLRSQTHTKLDERLNEMARRLNKANQANEERYRTGMAEIESIKQQVAAAKKTYQRKAEDLELAHKERLLEMDKRLEAVLAQQRQLTADADAGRIATAEAVRLRTEMTGLRVERESLAYETDALRSERDALQGQTQHVAALAANAGPLQAQVASLTAAVQRKDAELAELRTRKEELLERLTRAEQETVSLKAKLANSDQLQSRLLSFEVALQSRDNELAAVRKRSSGSSSDLTRVSPLPAGGGRASPSQPALARRVTMNRSVGEDEAATSSSMASSSDDATDSVVPPPPPPPPPALKSMLSGVIRGRQTTSTTQLSSDELAGAPEPPVLDQRFMDWVTDPYSYDAWNIFDGTSDTRSPPLALPVKGYQFEVGSASAAPLGDDSHLLFVEPLERVPYYQQCIAVRPHVHFVGASKTGEHMVLSVEMATTDNRGAPLLALLHTKTATLRVVVNMERVPLPPKVKNLFDQLDQLYPGCNLKLVDDDQTHELVSQRVAEFERMHADVNRRVGILYWKSGQNENDAFGNQMSPGLDEFLNFFGQRIQLRGWNKFRGGLNVTNDETGHSSVFAEFREFSFMAHVSALLPYNENDAQKLDRKRHIGNDLVVIIFWEGPGSWDASQLVTQMCHVFIVVERVKSRGPLPRYRMSVVCRAGVQPFRPYLPSPPEMDADETMRTWLFMKIINGERAAFQAKTFLTKTSTARKTLLDKMAKEAMAAMEDPPSLSDPWIMAKFAARGGVMRAKAAQPFQSPSPLHLSFKKGEEIVVFCRMSTEWWNGAVGGRRGDFPSKYVTLIEKKDKKRVKRGKRGSVDKALAPTPAMSQSSPNLAATAAAAAAAGAAPGSDAAVAVPYSHEISLQIVSGHGLAAKDLNGLSDPYVKVCVMTAGGPLDGSEFQTRNIQKTLNPEWNETHLIRITDPMWEVLRLEVWDADLVGSDDFMGMAEVACGELIEFAGAGPQEITLEAGDEHKNETVSGSVRIAVMRVTPLQPAGADK